MPSCARCGACEGELSYELKKSRKGIRVNLQPINNSLFCGIKCHNVWSHAQTQRRQAQEHATRRQNRIEQLNVRIRAIRARIYACSVAKRLPVPTRNFHGQYAVILALVNHWKQKQPPKPKTRSLPTNQPIKLTTCRYHFSTCYDDKCTTHYDDKISNRYFPQPTRWRKPLPANDKPVVATAEILRCKQEEDAFRGT